MGYKKFKKQDYAAEMGVHPTRISKLIKDGRLKTVMHMGSEMVIASPSNAKLFDNPNFWRGKNKPKSAKTEEIKNK